MAPATREGGTVPHHEPRQLATLADRLDFLFANVYPADRGRPWTNEEAARLITESGTPISDSYLGLLRKGVRDNPTKKHLEALARFFEVAPAFFFDDDMAERMASQIEILAVLARSPEVRQMALRAAELPKESLGALTALIESVRQMEGGARGRVPEEPPPDAG
jgi:transcriptional regulator with XRE-family HTH domain